MYKTFRVKNFRCFKDLQINDLGRVNLIAGKNNTGKTALMEAMYIFSKPGTPQTAFQLQHQVRALDAPNEDLPTYWMQLFSGMDTGNTIELSAKYTFQKHQLERNPFPSEALLAIDEISDVAENSKDFAFYRNLLYRPDSLQDALYRGKNSAVALKFTLKHENMEVPRPVFFSSDLLDDSIPEAEAQSWFIPVHSRPSNESIADQFSQLMLDNRHSELISVLSNLASNITDLRVLSPYGERLIWATLSGEQIPLRLMGEGVNRFAHFIMTMMTKNVRDVFIDEIENGIHYTAQMDVWKAIGRAAREENIQVFATTHSYEMIEAAHKAFKDDDPYEFRFHRLYRDSTTGNIEARTYDEFGVDAAISREREIRG